MKHFLAVLLCLLLCGCASQTAQKTIPETEVPTETAPEKVSMYAPGHPMELAYPDEVRAYPLTMRKTHGILAFQKDVLVLSGMGSTRLTLLSGEELWEEASVILDFELRQEDPSLRLHDGHLSYFDPVAQETVVLNKQLTEVRRITAPSGLSGKPLLSYDQNILYYCTDWSVMAWDLESGIRRTLRELNCESQEVCNLHAEDSVIQCRILEDGSEMQLFLSAENGKELDTLAGASIITQDSRYFAAISAGSSPLLVFGEAGSDPRMLLPEHFHSSQYYMAEDHAAVTVRDSSDGIKLDYYELSTGIARASLTLDPLQMPKNIINCKGHALYILAYDPDADCDILYRWDVLRQPPDAGNTQDHTFPYFSADAPDTVALVACREYAKTIGETYGVNVRIWEDAAAIQPWDYRFTPEHLTPILRRELKLLENCLSRYPEAILRKTAEHFSGLTFCLVREISGTQESGSLSTATGIQFFQDGGAYVVISTGKYAQQALYHELYHAMESLILTESTGLDQWDSLNPAGFDYGPDNQIADVYLRGQIRAFVDNYSTTYPKEDRARIFEYAMLDGTQELFRSDYMQRKLNALCTAIRDAYGLKRSPEILPWEQYLVTPIVPKE